MLDFDPFCPLVGNLFPWEGGAMGKVVSTGGGISLSI